MSKFLCCILALTFSISQAYSQDVLPDEKRVVFYAEDMLLEDALVSLAKKSGVNIAYNNEIIPDNRVITISAKGNPVGQILDYMLSDTELKYIIVGNQIVIEQDFSKVKSVAEFVTIRGTVTDEDTGESLPYANIYTHDNKVGAASNEYGYYVITVPVGDVHLFYSYIGYQLNIVDKEVYDDATFNVTLKSTSTLNEVLILDDPISAEATVDNAIDVPVKLLSSMVPLAGEADILKFLQQSTPGISTGADGVGGLSVRGGSVDHNLFLLDGVPVYEVNHALGLFSVFNNYAIKNSTLYKSSFPAKYGGRLASVVDIRTKEGNINEFGGEVGIGSITGKFSVEGPIEKGKSSFIVSGRRTFLDPFITSVSNVINNQSDSEGDRSYRFYDIFAKMNFKINDSNRIFFTFFNGDDRFNSDLLTPGEDDNGFPIESNRLFEFQSTNTLVGIKWNHKFSNSTFMRTNVYWTAYSLDAFELLDIATFSSIDEEIPDIVTFDGSLFTSQIRDLGLQLDIDRVYHSGNQLSFGLHTISHGYTPGVIQANESTELVDLNEVPDESDFLVPLTEDRLSGIENRLYGQYDLKYGEKNVLSFGLNQAIHIANNDDGSNQFYFIPEPRISWLQHLGKVEFRVSYARHSQFNHRISTSSLGWPLDIWVPSTSFLAPQTSSIYSISFTNPVNEKLKLYLEGYYRTFRNLTTFNAGAVIDISEDSNWELLIPTGGGNAYGVEVGMDKQFGKFIVAVNYTWSFTDRQFDLINLGNRFPYRFERRHSVKTSMVYRIGDNAEVAANWLYGTGNPTTVPSDITIDQGDIIILFDELNGDRLAPYHRLDFGFNFYNDLKWAKMKVTIGAYNVYNRENPFYLDIIPGNTESLRQFSILPLIPSVSINIQF